MGAKTKALTAGTKGLIATTAGLVTVAVGLLTIGATLGWFGGGGDAKSSETTGAASTETGGGGSSSGASSPGGAVAESPPPPRWAVEPAAIQLGSLTAREKVVTLKNTGEAPFSVGKPALGGADRAMFQVVNIDCSSRLAAGESCQVKVQYVPDPAGTHSAKLAIPLAGGESVAEVPLSGNVL